MLVPAGAEIQQIDFKEETALMEPRQAGQSVRFWDESVRPRDVTSSLQTPWPVDPDDGADPKI